MILFLIKEEMRSKNFKEISIFIDAHVFDEEFQGVRVYIQELYLHLITLCPEIIFTFGAKELRELEKIFGKFKNVKFIKYKSSSRLKRIFLEIPFIINKYDFTYAHFQYVLPAWRKRSCKYILTIHDILFNDFPKEFPFFYRLQRNVLFYLSAKTADKLITVSNYSRHRIAKKYNVELSSIYVTLNAVPESFFSFSSTKFESKKIIKEKYGLEKFILYVSRIEKRKNQDLLIDCFIRKKIFEKGFQLTLVGNDTLESGFHDKVSHYNLKANNSIKWLKKIDSVDLMHLYNACEFFIYPSLAEGFGIPPLEAASLNAPVLCSNVTAMEDFNFFMPYTFDPNQRGSLEKGIDIMLDNYEEIQTMAIKEKIYKKYSWKKTAAIFKKIIFN